MADEAIGRVPILTENNFRYWRLRLYALLDSKELLICIEEEKIDQNANAWIKADKLAKSIILNSISNKHILVIEKCKHAKDMMRELQKAFSGIHEKYQCRWILEIIGTKLNSKKYCNDHISRLLNLYSNLEASGMEMQDCLKRGFLYASLGSPFKNFIEVNQELEGQDFECLLAKLRAACIETDRSFSHEGQKTNESNFITYEQRRRGKPQTPPTKKIICYNCNKEGHKANVCRSRVRNTPKQQKPKNEYTFKGNNKKFPKKPTYYSKAEHEQDNLYAKEMCYNAYEESKTSKQNKWIIDSGCTSHFSNNKDFFKQIDEYNSCIETANSQISEIKGKGHGILKCTVGNKIHENVINNLLYLPQAVCNMISVSALDKRGYAVHFENKKCTIAKNDRVIAEANMINNIYQLSVFTESSNLAKAKREDKISLQTWHRRMGHRQMDSIKQLQEKGLAYGICIKDNSSQLGRCECCILQKGHRPSFPAVTFKRSNAVLDLIHTDLCGPMNVRSIGHNKYILIFVDDYSRYTTTYLLKDKSQVAESLKKFINKVSNVFRKRPKIIQSDNGGEFVSREIETFLNKVGIVHHTTVAYTPEQNSIAERKFRSIIEMTRCLLAEAKLPKKLWGEAVQTSVYLQNRLPTKGASCTPYQLWHGRKPNLAHLRIFGSVAYSHIPRQRRYKLDSTTEQGIMVGYSPGNRGYRVLNTRTGSVEVRHVIYFDENKRIGDTSKIPNINSEEEIERQQLKYLPEMSEEPNYTINDTITSIDRQEEGEQCETSDNENEDTEIEINTDTEQPAERRSSRINKGIPPQRYCCHINSVHAQEPTSWSDIKHLPTEERTKWQKAANEEIDSLKKNKTWYLTQLPQGKNLIGCKWVFKIKKDSYGKIEKYKARLVAKGFSQKYGEDFDEIFAPVVKHTTIRTLLTIAASRKLIVKHVDVKTAFLYGNISEEIYMKQPPGYESPENKHLVCRLKRGLYGLKQGAKCWNETLDKILKELNFTQGKEDQCLYVRNKNGCYSYILTYVDDLLICCKSEKEYKEIATHLAKNVEIKELGNVSSYLGMKIERDTDGNFTLSQSEKIKELINCVNLEDNYKCKTPMSTDYLGYNDKSNLLPDNNKYRNVIGKILYICTSTRPDISNAISILSRKVNTPTEYDWTAVKRVVRYLNGTVNYKLRICGTDDLKLYCYVDSDWGGDPANYRSTTGYCFIYGKSPISWASVKQNLVSLSSTESEFYAATEATRELCWLEKLLCEFGLEEEKPIIVYEDNQSCINLIQNEKIGCRTKHIGVRAYRIKELHDEGTIKLTYCPTKEMTADILTKPLPGEAFERLRRKIGLIN